MGHGLRLGMVWSPTCPACARTKPVVYKVMSQFFTIPLVMYKTTNATVKDWLRNYLGVPVHEDEDLDAFEKRELLEEGTMQTSAMPTFVLYDKYTPNVILELISGGVTKPPDFEARQAFEQLLTGMLMRYDEDAEHRKAIKIRPNNPMDAEVSDKLWGRTAQ